MSERGQQIAGDPQDEADVEKRQVEPEARAVGDRPVEYGGEDHRSMREDHGEGEAEEDRVQHRVVVRAGHDGTEPEREQPGEGEPDVAGEQREAMNRASPLSRTVRRAMSNPLALSSSMDL